MRLLIVEDKGHGAADLRETREMFEVAEFRLAYSCDQCGAESVLKPDNAPPTLARCPMCSKEFRTDENGASTLGRALALYHEFYKYAIKHGLPLRFVAVTGTPGSAGS